MMSLLPNDILLIILFNLTEINDVIGLALIDKTMYVNLDNSMYIYWGINLYSSEFWKKANKRTPNLSKPLINMKMELLRLDKFEKYQVINGHKRWTNEDYYKYWESMELNMISRNKKIYESLNIL